MIFFLPFFIFVFITFAKPAKYCVCNPLDFVNLKVALKTMVISFMSGIAVSGSDIVVTVVWNVCRDNYGFVTYYSPQDAFRAIDSRFLFFSSFFSTSHNVFTAIDSVCAFVLIFSASLLPPVSSDL